jgi:hypothetical protein
LLLLDELGDELGVVGKVRVHDEDEVAGGVLYTVDVCSSLSNIVTYYFEA